MNIGLQGSETVVSRLRLNVATRDPALATMRLASLLRSAHLHPAGLAPAAIVFIRRLDDPMPGALRLDQSGGHLPALWDQAAGESLRRLVSGAARPALGAVSPSANAVVFLDRSELLACLASDWCEGSVTARWWWLSLLRQAAASQIVKELWRKTPEYIPAALDQLARANHATTFVSSFSDSEARFLLHAVVKTFGLYALTNALDTFASSDAPPLSEEKARLSSPGLPGRSDPIGERESAPASSLDAPWVSCVPESGVAELRPAQQSLLGISLMLQRAPTRVRAAGFAREVKVWRRRIILSDPKGLAPAEFVRTDESDRQRSMADVGSPKAGATTVVLDDLPSDGGEYSEMAVSSDSNNAPADPETKGAQTSSASRPIVDLVGDSGPVEKKEPLLPLAMKSVEASSEAVDLPSVKDVDDASADLFVACETSTETEFGGLFYLINLALYLRLYGDFTTPEHPGLELNIWDFVSLVGRQLVGQAIEDDPIWRLLAQLAARDDEEQPGSSFEPPNEWRVTPEWLEAFSKEGTLCWSVIGRRLRLFHSSGFPILDIPEDGDPSEQLRRELKRYERFEVRVSSFELNEEPALKQERETRNSKLETSPQVAAWLARLLPYVRARLRKALTLAETDDPTLAFCRQRARVRTTATHVDVYFTLNELPIAIRLAGLDRDPGWVPSAGRFVTFHFE